MEAGSEHPQSYNRCFQIGSISVYNHFVKQELGGLGDSCKRVWWPWPATLLCNTAVLHLTDVADLKKRSVGASAANLDASAEASQLYHYTVQLYDTGMVYSKIIRFQKTTTCTAVQCVTHVVSTDDLFILSIKGCDGWLSSAAPKKVLLSSFSFSVSVCIPRNLFCEGHG